MLTRQQFIEKINNVDWGFFVKDYPLISFLLRCSEDYSYIEGIALGKINTQNDIKMKAAAELMQKGAALIPVIGNILSMIISIGGIDLSAFKSISDSGIARQRLYEWRTYIIDNYFYERNGLPPLIVMNQRFINATQKLAEARPKCLSPTENCKLEHARYIVRTSLLKESQDNIYSIYYNYCINNSTFRAWLSEQTTGNNQNNQNNTNISKSSLPLLLGLGLLLGLKK